MKIFDFTKEDAAAGSKLPWEGLLSRPENQPGSLESTVSNILNGVKEGGDEALRRYSLMFDKVRLDRLEVTQDELDSAAGQLGRELKAAIAMAKENITLFHVKQRIPDSWVETMPGVRCWRKSLPIEKVGLYIPGGTAPLFSTLLMLGIPATIAGCREIILCSPPDTQGQIHPAILYAANLVGATRIFKVGGVQAIGAMAYGTESVPRVYKIFGPGNPYVTCAKQIVQMQGLAIDLPAGPSELAIYADHTANPVFVAADLLAQAEHGIDSQVLLVCLDARFANQVVFELDQQLASLPRKQIAKRALEHSRAFIVPDAGSAMQLLNSYAPEHLILACDRPEILANLVMNAGSVFLGHYSPESAGDYASGTNHVLPTHGYAKSYSGVSLDSFVKRISFQQMSPDGFSRIGKSVEVMAEEEGLRAHAQAVSLRLQALSAIKNA
jgi:histidinol dehydrogenase